MNFGIIITTVCIEVLILGGWAVVQLQQLRRHGARPVRS